MVRGNGLYDYSPGDYLIVVGEDEQKGEEDDNRHEYTQSPVLTVLLPHKHLENSNILLKGASLRQ